jgi:hypothetical protein
MQAPRQSLMNEQAPLRFRTRGKPLFGAYGQSKVNGTRPAL